MSSEFKNPEGLLAYGSIEYEQKVKKTKVKFEDAKKLLCKYIKKNEKLNNYRNLYFIYNDAYVFKNTGFGKSSLSGISVQGLDGLYINIETGKIDEVENNKKQRILLNKNNYIHIECVNNRTEFIK